MKGDLIWGGENTIQCQERKNKYKKKSSDEI